MPRSALFESPLLAQHRIEYIRDFLHWLNNERGTKQELAEGLWRWFIGFPDGPLRGHWKKQMEGLLRDTRHWPWRKLQAGLRMTVEILYDMRGKKVGPTVGPISFRLSTYSRRHGQGRFHLGPALPRGRNYKRWIPIFLHEFLADLEDLRQATMTRCRRKVCGSLFVRLRAKRRLYCSKRCRNLAVLEGLTQKAGRAAKRTGVRTKARGVK